MKISKKLISLLLAALMVVSCCVTAISVNAEETEETPFNLIKISNPDRGEREVDGLIDDRGTSYAWRLAKRGDDIYIATYRNLLSGVIALFEQALNAQGVSSDMVWALSDLITNGELPKAQDSDGAYIIKYNTVTGEFTKVFTFPPLMQCRMVVNYEGDIYAGSFSSVLPRQYLYKIDENDNVTEVFSTSNSFSIRANCVYDPGNGDHLYFAGADEREVLDEGDETRVRVAVWEKDADDDTVWNRVADYKDFYDYTDDAAMKNNTGCPVWELANHDGYIYAGMPYSRGFIIFRGRPAQEGEDANAYGWIWEEVVGKNNGVNFPGMSADPNGHDDGNFSTIVSVYEFNGELYCFDFDQTIMAELAFIQGALYKAAGQEVSLSDMVRPVYETLHHNQGLWKLNDETGEFELCKGFDELMEGTTNEYVWRAQEHNGYLYVSTMDSAVIYNYITKLTNGSMLTMNEQEVTEMVTYISNLIELIKPIAEDALTRKLTEALESFIGMLENVPEQPSDEEIAAYMAEYEALMDELQELMDQFIEEMNKEIEDAYAQFENGELDEEDVDAPLAAVGAAIDEDAGEDVVINPSPEDVIDVLKDFFGSKTSKVQEMLAELKQAAVESVAALEQKLEEAYNSIDWEGMRMYLWVSETVRNDTWGFDIVRTRDGVNFEVVTNDGLGDKYNYGCPAFLSTEEGLYIGTSNPFYGGQLWLLADGDIPEPNPDFVAITGTVTSFLDDESAISLDLRDDEGSTPYGCEISGNQTTYEIYGAEPGEYTLVVAKENHVTREYPVVIGTDTITLDVKICPIGDVTQDGKVTTLDFARTNAHAKGADPITDPYAFACGDVVGNDGRITTLDAARINAHAKGADHLF